MPSTVEDSTTKDGDWFVSEIHARSITPMPSEEKMRVYDEWAPRYDEECMKLSKNFGLIKDRLVALVRERETVNKDVRLLDAGCGTGGPAELYTPALNASGINVHKIGIDISSRMLEMAQAKGVYDQYMQADISKPLPSSLANVDVIVSVGVFLRGHCEAYCLGNILVCLKPKGYALFTVRKKTYEDDAEEYLKFIEQCGCEIVECKEIPQLGSKTCMLLTVQKKD